jgi:hypothetical protein
VASAAGAAANSLRFMLPVIVRGADRVQIVDPATIAIARAEGKLTVHTDAAGGFAAIPAQRTFSLVPGFAAVPLTVAMHPGEAIGLRLSATVAQ